MCYHKSANLKSIELNEYYHNNLPEGVAADWDSKEHYHDKGFDNALSPILTNEGFGYFRWGLIPNDTRSLEEANKVKINLLNCRSEEMYSKKSWIPSLTNNQRCLVPATGFFEHHWNDKKGKEKIPYYISLKDQPIFSFAGLYSTWQMPGTEDLLYTYTILTVKANPLMAFIHNATDESGEEKKRMPVILPTEFEKDWLNPNLTKEDVLSLCQPFDENKMNAYTISKRLTSRESNTPEVLLKHDYFSTGSLF